MIKLALTSLALTSLVWGSTTMCFKKDHLDPSNIETVPLDGGECKGKFSVTEMKKQGYDVKDIKITSGDKGMNYMYIFSKETVVLGDSKTAGGRALTKDQLKAYLYEMKDEEETAKKAKIEQANYERGKQIYESTCQQCHGDGTKRAYGTARPLLELSTDEIKGAFRDYDLGLKDNGMAIVMMPYAKKYTSDDVEAIGAYLQRKK